MCKLCAHCANWYYCFTPSLHRANRVNQSKHFTKFANYLHRFCCDLVLICCTFAYFDAIISESQCSHYADLNVSFSFSSAVLHVNICSYFFEDIHRYAHVNIWEFQKQIFTPVKTPVNIWPRYLNRHWSIIFTGICQIYSQIFTDMNIISVNIMTSDIHMSISVNI